MSHVQNAKPVNPLVLKFERTVEEQITVEIPAPSMTAADLEGWANFSTTGNETQLETLPTEQITGHVKTPTRWTLIESTPPLSRKKTGPKAKVRGKK